MKINGFLLADKSQNVPIPIPVDPVESGFTWSYSTPRIYCRIRLQNSGTYQPTGEWSDSYSNSYGPYTPQSEQSMPCSITWENEHNLPSGNTSSLAFIKNVTGTITLNIQNLPVGDYVAVFDHYIGTRFWFIDDRTPVSLLVNSSKTVRIGANGVVYGEVIGLEQYAGESYGIGRMWGVHLRQNCSFHISEGDTSKTFAYGDDSFSLPILSQTKQEGTTLSDVVVAAGNYLLNSGITAKLYTA